MTPEDFAQKIELAEYERNQAKAIMAKPTRPSAETCSDCGDDIPEARREAIPGVLYCAHCQTRREQENNIMGRR